MGNVSLRVDKEEANSLSKDDEELVVHPWEIQSQYKSIIFRFGHGCQVYDINGKKYLDFTSQIYNASLGHSNSHVIKSMIAQMQTIACISPTFGNIPKIRLAETLLSLAPGKYDRVFFGCNGTDAVELAIMVAKQITGRHKIISMWQSYHGCSLGTLSSCGIPGQRDFFGPLLAGHFQVPPAFCYRCAFDLEYPKCSLRCAYFLEDSLKRSGVDQVAAVLLEPIPLATIAVPPDDYLPTVRDICHENDVMLIIDEVLTGMGRTGKMFCVEHYNVSPDMITLGKGISSGYAPLSATLFSENISAFYDNTPLVHGLTYSGNPVSCSAGLATLEVFMKENLVETSSRMGGYLEKVLLELQQNHPSIGDIRCKGLLAAIEMVRNRDTKEAFTPENVPWNKKKAPQFSAGTMIVNECMKAGLIVDKGYCDTVILAPPLIVTKEEIDSALDILGEIITKIDQRLKCK